MTDPNSGNHIATHSTTTRDYVRELRKTYPNISASAIASVVGVSKERIRQILLALGLPTAIYRPKMSCAFCGVEIQAGRVFCASSCRKSMAMTSFHCDGCGTLVSVLKSNLNARLRRGSRTLFCSRNCKTKSSRGQGGGRRG